MLVNIKDAVLNSTHTSDGCVPFVVFCVFMSVGFFFSFFLFFLFRARRHIDETHLNIVSPICFIFSVFSDLVMNKKVRVVWDKNSLLFVSFL